MRAMRIFLWIATVGWAASPPASFALLPYGKRYPVDPGDFFIPLSALIAVGSIGALISGWRSSLRPWLLVSVVSFLIIWATTPTVFWPMIHQLYGTAIGRVTATDAESVRLAQRWLVWDTFRVLLIAVGFVAIVRAMSFPATTKKV